FVPQPPRPPGTDAALRRSHGAGALRTRTALRHAAGTAQSAVALRTRLPAAPGISRWLARTRVRARRVRLRAAQVPRAIRAQSEAAGLTRRLPAQDGRADRPARAAAVARRW